QPRAQGGGGRCGACRAGEFPAPEPLRRSAGIPLLPPDCERRARRETTAALEGPLSRNRSRYRRIDLEPLIACVPEIAVTRARPAVATASAVPEHREHAVPLYDVDRRKKIAVAGNKNGSPDLVRRCELHHVDAQL